LAAIDVLLPVRNGAQYLADSIDSIRRQTFSDWRLLVLDHGSVDNSAEIAHKYSEMDSRVEVISLPRADGLAGLLNIGLERCDCHLVMRQDADDISVPERMQITNDLFQRCPALVIAGGDAVVIESSGRQIGYLRMPKTSAAVSAASFFYNPFAHPTVTVNFSIFKKAGAAYGKDIFNVLPRSESVAVTVAQDYYLFGQLALLGPCINVDTPLIKYRRHSDSVGSTKYLVQIELSLQISRFLAKSFCVMNGLDVFDPAPFCNHGDYVYDLRLDDYSDHYDQMAIALRRGLGRSVELERELAFRWVMTTRSSFQMARRYLQFSVKYGVEPVEYRTVRNWLLRNIQNGKYVYSVDTQQKL
jgi:glycosyltransferase involved in cell wall biosynthesis